MTKWIFNFLHDLLIIAVMMSIFFVGVLLV